MARQGTSTHRQDFEPYTAANGHRMVPGTGVRRDGSEYPIYALAQCVDPCPACRAGDDPSWYCGEE